MVFAAFGHRAHELVVDLDRHVGAGHLARFDFCVDEVFRVGVLDRQRQHQRAAPAVLSHFARRVRIALHERHDARRGQRAVQHRTAGGADVREVMSYPPAPLHQLHLLLVDTDDSAVGVGRLAVTDHEAVRQRGDLQVVADSGHRASLRNQIAEILQQVVYLAFGHRIRIAFLDALDFPGDAAMHLLGRVLVDFSHGVFQRVLADPDRGRQVVALEIGFGRFHRVGVLVLLQRAGLLFVSFRGHDSVACILRIYDVSADMRSGAQCVTRLRTLWRMLKFRQGILSRSYQHPFSSLCFSRVTETFSIFPPRGGAIFETLTRTRTLCGNRSRMRPAILPATCSRMCDGMSICSRTVSNTSR